MVPQDFHEDGFEIREIRPIIHFGKAIIAHDRVYFSLGLLLNCGVQDHDEDKRRQRSGCL